MSTYLAKNQTLTFGQVEALWIKEGGAPAWAATFAGIAMAESGGNTAVLNNNPSTGDYSVGLFQINYFGSMLASRTASYGSPAALAASPAAQVRAAVNLLGGGPGISNWTGDTVGQVAVNNGSRPLSLGSVLGIVSSFNGNTANAVDATTKAGIARLDAIVVPGTASLAKQLSSVKGYDALTANEKTQVQKIVTYLEQGNTKAADGMNPNPAVKAVVDAWGLARVPIGGWGSFPGVSQATAAAKSVASDASSVTGLIGKLESGATWKRVGEFVLGTALVIGGLIVFFESTSAGKKLTSDAAVAAVS
jgi:hypothetical protein